MATLRAATDSLLDRAAGLDSLGDDAVRAPSALPGWTRGHVLTHLARNADALVNVLTGRPMYPSAEARDADIAAGAPRPLAEQLDDVRATADRLAKTAAGIPSDGWSARCELRGGVTDVMARIPFRRLVEVELHHVDLAAGYTLDQLPEDFVTREIEFLSARFAGNEEVPPLSLHAPGGQTWTTGAARSTGTGGPVRVTGAPYALMGWLAGRTTGAGVRTEDGAVLPTLPPL
ncbi:maleylpyruvate isomerase family mycothiol-dependent enzyme [Streptomyces sp. WMMC500]|uniref:maleylpyruvate isomerase family mycothiol-dependent enzyme n=1 Tax=Streptomyces sp. WMMC500 TaxID=3015154 RepID=UPI00248B7B59|nr:maleylpyruvate isomerase family mycothiol-dependent enzyme [Streptomyces sp. WMMC500]WBB64712.1 maleylpyruvate isomerase family mycothiol-dependent enzyme [Streptomyces sp. WMMC500]